MLPRALVAEFIGTFALVFAGAGAGALGVGWLGVALAHGLVLIAMSYSYGHISGSHINPAVTVALWVAKQIDAVRATSYVAVQLAGGVTAGFVLAYVLGGVDSGLGATLLAPGVDPSRGLFLEALLTFFLVNAVMNAAVSGRAGPFAGLAVGSTLIVCMLAGGPLTGASLNPSRTLGPAVASGQYAHLWLYVLGPLLGGVLAALLYTGLLRDEAS